MLWEQDIFVHTPTENPLSQELIASLAIEYAPIAFLHGDEEYLPSSIEYIFNEVDVDETLAAAEFVLDGSGSAQDLVFPFSEVREYLSTLPLPLCLRPKDGRP